MLRIGTASLADTPRRMVEGNSSGAEETDESDEVDVSGRLVVFEVAEEELLVCLTL